ncbi:hypothetical protein SO802_031728 [Lithocarpus litseifolius]|uniref:Uncharacterized protein n=1 Tax=Lithocarpus litseifolius TaxID=425828 RepID=A0AAW2BNQ9_9ROSI
MVASLLQSKRKSNRKGGKSQSSSDDVVEVPPPATGGALVKEAMVAQPAAVLSVEKESPNGGIAEEVGQAMKDAQPILPPVSFQDPEAFPPPIPQDPKSVQTTSPTKTMTFKPTTEFTLGKESFNFAKIFSPFLQRASCSFVESSEKSEGQEEEPPIIANTIQRIGRPPTLEGGDTTMGEAPEMAISDPSSGFPAFLARFGSLEFNSLPASHFHRFRPPFGSFLHFSVPVEGFPLLEELFKAHGDFTSGFRGGIFLDNIPMELLCTVLISLRDSSLDSLSEEGFWSREEWKVSEDLNVEIAAAKEALARAYKALQDLKGKKQLVLSSSIVPAIPSRGSLLTGLMP